MNFGQKIKQLRAKNDLNQEEFAKSVGVGQTTVAHWEKYGTMPEMPTVLRICQKYKILIGDLINVGKIPDRDAIRMENTQLKKQVALLERMVDLLSEKKKTKA